MWSLWVPDVPSYVNGWPRSIGTPLTSFSSRHSFRFTPQKEGQGTARGIPQHKPLSASTTKPMNGMWFSSEEHLRHWMAHPSLNLSPLRWRRYLNRSRWHGSDHFYDENINNTSVRCLLLCYFQHYSLFTKHEVWYQKFIAPAPTEKHRTHLLSPSWNYK